MRQFLLGLSISAAFILGCVTAQHMPELTVASAAARGGQTIEYLCVGGNDLRTKVPTVAMPGQGGGEYSRDLQDRLNELGRDGWMPTHLVQATTTDQCFLRFVDGMPFEDPAPFLSPSPND